VGIVAIAAALISIAVGESGPRPQDVGGINDTQRVFGGIEQAGDAIGPADAEITVSVFNDLQCSACATYHRSTVVPLIESYARTGEARVELRHFSIAPNDTTLAAIAAEAAGEQARQWQFADLFFRNQGLARERGVDEALLREIAVAVPQLEISEWEQAYGSAQSEEAVRADAMLASELELPAEPAVVVDGPGGTRTLIESPALEGIEAAIAEVAA
jgi:protein-disulfide isomerase